MNDARKTLAAIKARLDDCQSYNFGTRRLAYEDAPALVAALEAVMDVENVKRPRHREGMYQAGFREGYNEALAHIHDTITEALGGEWG